MVENSIDAGASQIVVENRRAGLKSGADCYRYGEECTMRSLWPSRRHATNKIKSPDLFVFERLVFVVRPCLPLLLSVFLTLLTAQEGLPGPNCGRKGWRNRGGAATKPCWDQDHSGSLFLIHPARLKVFKEPAGRAVPISWIFQPLVWPILIAFTLINDGKNDAKQRDRANLRQSDCGCYGLASAKKMVPIENRDLDFEVTGFLPCLWIESCQSNYISLFINGRYIRISCSIRLF